MSHSCGYSLYCDPNCPGRIPDSPEEAEEMKIRAALRKIREEAEEVEQEKRRLKAIAHPNRSLLGGIDILVSAIKKAIRFFRAKI